MNQYLIDAHLPSKINLWKGEKFVHVRDIDPSWSDSQIWNYAKKNELTIVTYIVG